MVVFDSTDLDNAASESGVVHESVANTDHNDASNLKQGYSYSSVATELAHLYPMHGDSGGTMYDVVGSANGSHDFGTLGQPGVLSSTAVSYDGVDDYGTTGTLTAQPDGIEFWIYLPTDITSSDTFDGDGGMVLNEVGAATPYLVFGGYTGNVANETFSIQNNGLTAITDTIPSGLNYIYCNWNGSSYDIWLNGVQKTTISASTHADLLPASAYYTGARQSSSDGYLECRLMELGFYNAPVSDTYIQERYDVVTTAGSLTTQYKPL